MHFKVHLSTLDAGHMFTNIFMEFFEYSQICSILNVKYVKNFFFKYILLKYGHI